MGAAFQASGFQGTAFQTAGGHTCPDHTKSYVGSYVATAVNDGCIDGLICAPSRTHEEVREPGSTTWTLMC